MAGTTPPGAADVRSTMAKEYGLNAWGRYANGRAGRSTRRSTTSAMMPITCHVFPLIASCRPIGFSPGNTVRAAVALITATRGPSGRLSDASNRLPLTSLVPSASRYPSDA